VTDVLIVGAGPVGMLLAAELARLGAEASVVESRIAASPGTRAVGLHAPALSALEASGATDRLLADAHLVRSGVALSAGRLLGTVRFDRLRSRHPYVATLPQHATEAALLATSARWGAPDIRRGVTVQAVRPGNADGAVTVESEGPEGPAAERVGLVVIATGWRGRAISPLTTAVRVREYPDRYLMTDARDTSTDGSAAVVRLETDGVLESFPLPGRMRRYVAWVPPGGAEDGVAAADRLRGIVARRMRTDHGADAITAATAFGVRRALIPAMRADRVFAIGDAAHEVSPIGGQGMNLGLIDAATLAPLLARWVQTGRAPEDELRAWERRRLVSARRAGHLAALNTTLGRPLSSRRAPLVRATLRTALAGRPGTLFAHLYTMGRDTDAR
jgi:2-polyprenyl-6-methoxyphenol hydroxylase-like FAD-dependent oxidoreductase